MDWLYAHDPTKLFAGIAVRAYQGEDQQESEASVIAITYGYSRDHREDLKQWMLAASHEARGRCAAVFTRIGRQQQ